MKRAFRIILIICAVILIIGVAMLVVSLFLGGGVDSVVSHGNVDGLIDSLRSMFPFLEGFLFK